MNVDKEIKWLKIQIERTLYTIKKQEDEGKIPIEKFTLAHYVEIKNALEKLKTLKQMQQEHSLIIHKLKQINPKLLKHIRKEIRREKNNQCTQ